MKLVKLVFAIGCLVQNFSVAHADVDYCADRGEIEINPRVLGFVRDLSQDPILTNEEVSQYLEIAYEQSDPLTRDIFIELIRQNPSVKRPGLKKINTDPCAKQLASIFREHGTNRPWRD